MDGFVAVLVLLVIASIVNLIAKKINFPYTILLFVTGVLLIPLSRIPGLEILNTFYLTPELLFYVFLPVLIFESWYNIRYHQLSKNSLTIWTLATIGLLIAIAIIALGGKALLWLAWFDVPLLFMVLFGVVISSTDPVAVLSIFKNLWTPSRLSLIFEWESLFNDGTAVALFLILLEIIRQWGLLTWWTILTWLITFIVMVVWWIMLGTILWIFFSRLIKYIKNNEAVEITLTMILAHFTFIFAEYISEHVMFGGFNLKISGVIATAYAAIIMGNYGKSKISPKVEEYMDKFWSFFAFITNSLVFLLMGMILQQVSMPLSAIWLPVLLSVLTVFVARGVSIYVPLSVLNATKRQEKIPSSRQHLLARWSLRWALWLMLVLLVPDDITLPWWSLDYSVKEFLLVLTIGCIMFSLILKWLTIGKLINRLKLNKLHDLEEFEKYESEVLVYSSIIEKIEKMSIDYHISKDNYDQLKIKYEAKKDESILKMQIFLKGIKHADELLFTSLSIQALWIEKQYLKEMFTYNEFDEYIYMYLLGKIERQMVRVEQWKRQLTAKNRWYKPDRLMKILNRLQYKKHTTSDHYIINRTKYIVSAKVIQWLRALQQTDFGYDTTVIDPIVALYQKFNVNAHQAIVLLKQDHADEISSINARLLNKWLMKTEEHLVVDLYAKEMITHKLYKQFMEEIEWEVLKDVCSKTKKDA